MIHSPQNLGLMVLEFFVIRDGVEDLTLNVDGFELQKIDDCLQRCCLGIVVEASTGLLKGFKLQLLVIPLHLL